MATSQPHDHRRVFNTLEAGGTLDQNDANFAWLGGRRYFAHAPYLLPCDKSELSRQDFEHHALRQALRANIVAPVGQPRAILDVGGGTGRWALEVAAQLPSTQVTAVDLILPTTLPDSAPSGGATVTDRVASVPRNFRFRPGNVLQPLPFVNEAFDYVHMRFLSAAIPLAAWRPVLSELTRVTQRGGWIEVVDTSWTPVGSGPATEQLFNWARIAGMVHEINLQISAWIGSLLLDTGLGNVTAPKLRFPMGRRAGHIGSMFAANAIGVAEAMQPWIVGYNITTADSYAAALDGARTEVMEGACEYPLFIAYGQRI